MERLTLAADLDVTVAEGRIGLHGELRQENAMALLQWLEAAAEIAVIEMDELDIADGVACTQAVNLIRLILMHRENLCIHGAPQVLAHNLYRTGLLAEGRIVLQSMREDEAYG
jgi:hypothetical protein